MNSGNWLIFLLAVTVQHVMSENKCKRSRIRYCASLGFKKTYKENIIGQTDQRVVIRDKVFKDLQLLDRTGCSELVKPFACSIYTPICLEKFGFLPPCRSFCNAVKQPCGIFINMFRRRKTKVELDCSFFPEPSKTEGCIDWVLEGYKPVMKIRGNPTKEQLKNKKIPAFYKKSG